MRAVLLPLLCGWSLLLLSLQAGAECDTEAGKRLFSKCAVCHTYDDTGVHGVGPNLWGVIGREAATAKGFLYSPAMEQSGWVWGPERLDQFLANPMQALPGTTMAFAGLKEETQRQDILCYIEG